MILSDSSALSLSSAMESILLSSSEGGEWEGGELEDTEDGERRLEAGSEKVKSSSVIRMITARWCELWQ